MATRNQAVRNSLLRSSTSIKNIGKSVTAFTSGFSTAQKSAENMVESIEEDNKFKKNLLVTDSSYFRKRQENMRRKDREDEIEASSVGGAIKKTGDIAQTSTRGFLGRILDFIGVLFIGWMVSTLPALIKGITAFISNAGDLLNSLRNFTNGLTDTFTQSNEQLGEIDQKREVESVQFTEEQARASQEADGAANAFQSINQQLSQQFQIFKDPKNAGFTESSWDKVGDMDFDDKDKPTSNAATDKANNIGALTPGGMSKKPDDKEVSEDKKEEKKEFALNTASAKQKDESSKPDTSETDKKIKDVVEEKDPFDMTKEEEEDSGIDSRRTNVKVTKDQNGNVTKTITYEDGTERFIYSPISGGYEQKTIWPDGTETKNSFDFNNYADGGRPTVGETSVVGEKGPELFVADKSGTILPSSFFDKKIKGFTDKLTENLEIGETNEEVLQSVADEKALTGKKSETSDTKKIDISKVFGNKELTDDMEEKSREVFDNLGVDPGEIGGLLDNLKSITTRKIRDKGIPEKIASGRKKPKVIVVPVPSPQPQTQQKSSPKMSSSPKQSMPITVSKSAMVNSITNKLHELELSYT